MTHYQSSPTISGFYATIRILCVILLLPRALGQGVGTAVCACQPSIYTLTLSFDSLCGGNGNIASGPGIVETVCIPADAFGFGIDDFRPVNVTSIQFIELNADQVALQQVTLRAEQEGFVDGSEVLFESVLAVPRFFNPPDLPVSLYCNMRGFNALGQAIQIIWTIAFDNGCDLFPILDVGQEQGWTVFVSDLVFFSVFKRAENVRVSCVVILSKTQFHSVLFNSPHYRAI